MPVDLFLKIRANGTWLVGDSVHKSYKDWIELESFSWGVSAPVSSGGHSSGARQYKEFRWIARTQRALIGLWQALAQNQTIEAELHALRQDRNTGEEAPFLKFFLKNARMTAVDQAVEEEPMEEYALVFQTIRIEDDNNQQYEDSPFQQA